MIKFNRAFNVDMKITGLVEETWQIALHPRDDYMKHFSSNIFIYKNSLPIEQCSLLPFRYFLSR